MDKTQKTVVAVLALLLVLALGVTLLVRSRDRGFAPPPFESAAEKGTPTLTDEKLRFGYATVYEGLTVGLCGECVFADGALQVYFSSPEDNEAWVRIKIYNEKGKLLGESGILRPGEYVKSIALSSAPKGDTLKIKLLSYEPNTYYSLGSAELTVAVC